MDFATQLIVGITACVGLLTAIVKGVEAYHKRKSTPKGESELTLEQNAESSLGTGSIMGDNNVQTFTVNIGSEKTSTETTRDKRDNDSIMLKPLYTSLFAEKGKVQHERIEIKNLGRGKIEGDVYLDAQYIYKLTGTFKNRILTGEFTAVGEFVDERGTINLKLIDHDILSGFCSFSKISIDFEDQIRVSPYVWVAGEDNELIHGTYQFCTNCHSENKVCCCASDEIDMPVLLGNEVRQIQSSSIKNKKMKDFSHNIGQTSIRQMRAKTYDKDGKAIRACHFYDVDAHRCKIYDTRPTDCRLFPFDIKLDPNTNEYWLGYYDELCERNLPDEQAMKKYAHILRPFIFLLFPFANIITMDTVCEKLKDAHFVKLYRLNEFVF